MHKEACERRDFLPGLVWFLSRAGFGTIVFDVGDPVGSEVSESIPNVERRAVVPCYSSPGVHPKACMELYGTQLPRSSRRWSSGAAWRACAPAAPSTSGLCTAAASAPGSTTNWSRPKDVAAVSHRSLTRSVQVLSDSSN